MRKSLTFSEKKLCHLKQHVEYLDLSSNTSVCLIFQLSRLIFNNIKLTENGVEMVPLFNTGNLTSQISEIHSSLYRTGKIPTVCKCAPAFPLFSSPPSQNYIPTSQK
jgi:hypothetical protein